MPCGFPGLGIPPLAPLRAAHREFNIDNGGIQAFGEVNNFRVDGLDNFDIVEFVVSTIRSRVNFKFNWNNVKLTTDYSMSSSLDGFRMKRSGPATVTIKNLTVWGRISYSLGLIGSGGIKVKEISIYASLDEVKSEIEGLSKIKIINKKLNEIIEEWILLAINDNTENLATLTNEHVTPIVNSMVEGKTLRDIIGMVGGGGGGEGGEKVPCVPPAEAF